MDPHRKPNILSHTLQTVNSINCLKVVILFLLLFLMIPRINEVTPLKESSKKSNNQNYGKFLIHSGELIELGNIPGRIGKTFSLTITVDGNSTSAVNVTAYWNPYINESEIWEGNLEFLVAPNCSHTEIYICHAVADYPLDLLFKASLLSKSASASGFYNITTLHIGHFFDVGTGFTSIDNITKWLQEISAPTTQSTITFPLSFSLVFCFLIILRRKKLQKVR